MSARLPKVPRGQAVVETALGMLVFVTVLVLGIHFAEVTVFEMKMTEATASAVWDSTSGQMHVIPRLTGNFTDVRNRVNFAQARANARYGTDFDGRTVTNGAAPRQVYTTANGMRVTCRTGVGMSSPRGTELLLLRPHQWSIYDDNDGMGCVTQGDIRVGGAANIGAFLEDSQGFFSQGTSARQREGRALSSGNYRVCGLNRPQGFNGPCRGEAQMLIDDWGMAEGGQEEEACPVYPMGLPCIGVNYNYWMAGFTMYTLSSAMFMTQNRADYNIVSRIVSRPPAWAWNGIPFVPGNPTSFYMSFCGENPALPTCTSAFTVLAPWMGDGSWWIWMTTPFGLFFPTYTISWAGASGCYLGKNCSASTPSNP